jgi:hypothetical protein
MNLPYAFKIPYDEDGKTFIRVLRTILKNSGGGRIKLRGRGSRMGVRKYRQDLPLKFAKSVRVYTA